MNQENWEQLYTLATLEGDRKRMQDRIAAVREAVHVRLQDLDGNSDHHAERERMTLILRRLKILESESQEW
jgi:hypothetical protein